MLTFWKLMITKQVISDGKDTTPIAIRRMPRAYYKANKIIFLSFNHLILPTA